VKYGVVQGRLKDAGKDEFEAAAEMGFDGLELVFGAGDYERNPVWTPEGAAELKRKAEAAGIELPSLCTGYFNQRGLAAPEREVRETGIEVLLHLIDQCADVGMSNILVAFFAAGEIKEAKQEDYVVAAMERCAPKARERNVKLALETTLPAERFRRLLERINHPFVGIYYDLANPVMWGENPAEGLDILSDFVLQIHIKDRDEEGTNVMLGQGKVDFPAVVETVRKIGYDGYMVLETPAGTDKTRTNLEFIKKQMDS